MSEERGKTKLKASLLTLVAFILACFIVAWGGEHLHLRIPSPSVIDRQNHNYNAYKDSKENANKRLSSHGGNVHGYPQEDADYKLASSNKSFKDFKEIYADTDAQEGMWRGAVYLVYLTFFQLILGAAGLILIAKTLIATNETVQYSREALDAARKSLEVTRETLLQSEATTREAAIQTAIQRDASRPFVMAQNITINGIPTFEDRGESARPVRVISGCQLNFVVKNLGAMPARKVQCSINSTSINNTGDIQLSHQQLNIELGSHHKINTVAPSEYKQCQFALARLSDGFIGNFFDDDEPPYQTIVVLIRLRYQDIAGRRFKEDKCFEIAGRRSNSGSAIINDAIAPQITVTEHAGGAVDEYPDYSDD